MILKQSVSADIAKDKFDACFSVLTAEHRVVVKATRQFANTPTGFAEFSRWAGKWENPQAQLVFIMEATGVYYENLAWRLHQQGRQVVVMLPNRARKFAQSLGHKSKNDRIDAKALAHMGAERHLAPWQPMSPQLYLLRKLTREHEQVQLMRTEAINRLHAESHAMLPGKGTQRRLNKTLQLYEAQLQQIAREIKATLQADAQLEERIQKITTIPGVGLLTAATLVAETNGFALFTSHKQLVSYAGYDVVENQSGNRVGREKISKQGNSHIRRILHMPALNAVSRKVPVCRALYERLTGKGKRKMVAYVAVQKKLLVLIYTLWKRNQAFDPQYGQKQEETENNNLIQEAGASLSGVSEADKDAITEETEPGTGEKEIAPAQARATQDELPLPVGPGALFQVD
nr:IS110 family transposase [Pontibacter korlensis]